MQAADCKGRFAGDLLDSLRALIFWRPIEGDFESVRVPDLSYQTDLTHLFHGEQNKRENFSTTDGMGGGERLCRDRVLAKKLARYPVNGRKRSLRDIAADLEAAGHVTSAGTRYGAAAVARMIGG